MLSSLLDKSILFSNGAGIAVQVPSFFTPLPPLSSHNTFEEAVGLLDRNAELGHKKMDVPDPFAGNLALN